MIVFMSRPDLEYTDWESWYNQFAEIDVEELWDARVSLHHLAQEKKLDRYEIWDYDVCIERWPYPSMFYQLFE